MSTPQRPNEIQGEEIEAITSSALAVITRAEVDVQIATAKRYPRGVQQARNEALGLATVDQVTAASCNYSLPRGNKPIIGPSIRLAEIVLCCWGNMAVAARVIDVGERTITAQAVAHDLEKNNRVSVEIPRRITDRNGKRYNDDMIVVTCAAAMSIARRNAIFEVIPRAYVDFIANEAKKVAVGDAATLPERRDALVKYINDRFKVPNARILQVVNRNVVEDITLDDLFILHSICTSIKDNLITVEDGFPVDVPSVDGEVVPTATRGKGKNADIASKLKSDAAGQTATPPGGFANPQAEALAKTAAAEKLAPPIQGKTKQPETDPDTGDVIPADVGQPTRDAAADAPGTSDASAALSTPETPAGGADAADGQETQTAAETAETVEKPNGSSGLNAFVRYICTTKPADLIKPAGGEAFAFVERRMKLFLPKKWEAMTAKEREAQIDRVDAGAFNWK